LRELPAVRVTTRHGREATRDVLLEDLQSGQYDVVHYAGHAYFNVINRPRSGILCHGQEVLAGEDLVGLGNLPALVFFNACESGRVRQRVQDQAMYSAGLAEAFLRRGVANCVGTYWPVGDEPAVTFAREFYRQLVDGQPLGDAILGGRRGVRELPSKDWADYMLYGDPEFTLKRRDA
jgi:CHAT domain-containing protein